MLPHRIVAFGSSSVYGRGDPLGGGFVGRLRAWHEPMHSLNAVYNLGIGGDTSAGMLSRFQSEVSIRRPDLILLYPGLNDTRRTGGKLSATAISLDTFRSNLLSLAQLSTHLAPTVFISAFPPDETRTSPFREDWFYLFSDASEFTACGRQVCADLGVDYFPLFENWQKVPTAAGLLADGLHANPEGHQLMFEQLRDFLSERIAR